MAACLITNRIDSEFDINDIMQIHPDIVSELAQLYRDEEMKSIERLQESGDEQKEEPKIEQIEKKRRAPKGI